jgi:hypothetical protein
MLTKPDFEFDINFMDAASFDQLDARAQVLFTAKLAKAEKESAGLSEC